MVKFFLGKYALNLPMLEEMAEQTAWGEEKKGQRELDAIPFF